MREIAGGEVLIDSELAHDYDRWDVLRDKYLASEGMNPFSRADARWRARTGNRPLPLSNCFSDDPESYSPDELKETAEKVYKQRIGEV